MTPRKVTISIVEYLNSKPFLQGINKFLNNQCTVSLDVPSVCAQKVLQHKVDIGLVPVAVIPQMQQATIISDFCIGAVGDVRSVKLFSQVPREEIKKIYLDYQSRTSVNLIKVIAQKFWNQKFEWVNAESGYENLISNTTSAVIIGDRALEIENKYPFSYDLSGEWQHYTGLPFVFACWVSNLKLDKSFLQEFNSALKWGIDNRLHVLNEKSMNYDSLSSYLQHAISFELDDSKKKGLELFWSYLKEMEKYNL
ncbi:MAG: menaquinone biosynthesis protein [Bacteroidetes bacterium]|nr:menaquinone biosynthesis protein [Bacteroidota bacterium]